MQKSNEEAKKFPIVHTVKQLTDHVFIYNSELHSSHTRTDTPEKIFKGVNKHSYIHKTSSMQWSGNRLSAWLEMLLCKQKALFTVYSYAARLCVSKMRIYVYVNWYMCTVDYTVYVKKCLHEFKVNECIRSPAQSTPNPKSTDV